MASRRPMAWPASPKTCQRAAHAVRGGLRPRGTADGVTCVPVLVLASPSHFVMSRVCPGRAGPSSRGESMQVRKRNGDTEPVAVNKIVRAVDRCAGGLDAVDPLRVATKTISGLYDGATTSELDRLSIQTAAEMIGEEPQYSRLAARLLATYIGKEVRGQGIASFSQSIGAG